MSDTTLGSRLMELRKKRGMSMRELANCSDVSTSFISQVETGKTNPTVAKLQNLATALGVPVNYFFDSHDGPPPNTDTDPVRTPAQVNGMPMHSGVPLDVVRKSTRATFELSDGVTWARLTPHGRDGIEFLEVTYDIGVGSGPLASHFGEEFVLVIEGALQVQFGFHTVVLEEGDSLAFDSTVPHSVLSVGKVPVRALWVNWTGRNSDSWGSSMHQAGALIADASGRMP